MRKILFIAVLSVLFSFQDFSVSNSMAEEAAQGKGRQAESYQATSGRSAGESIPQVKVLSSTAQEIVTTIDFTQGFSYEKVVAEDGVSYIRYKKDDSSGFLYTSEEGKPELPLISKNFQIPADATNVRITIEETHYASEQKGIVYPAPEMYFEEEEGVSGSKERFVKDKAVYKKDEWNSHVVLKGTAKIRSAHVAIVEFHPVSFNPQKQSIKYCDSLSVRISYVSSKKDNTVSVQAKSPFKNIYEAMIPNYHLISISQEDNFSDPSQPAGPGINTPSVDVPGAYHVLAPADIVNPSLELPIDYLVVVADFFMPEGAPSASLATWLNWRASVEGGGHNIGVIKRSDIYAQYMPVDPDDSEGSSIREFIRFAYENWRGNIEVPDLDYVSLIGDADQGFETAEWFMPGMHENSGAITDHYYGCVDGDDNFPDVMVGRFPVKTDAELGYMVDKTLYFEQNPPEGENHWGTRGLYIGGYERGPAVTTPQKDFVLKHYQEMEELHHDDSLSPYHDPSVAAEIIKQGVLHVIYKDHGGITSWYPPLNSSLIPLINGNQPQTRYPALVVSIGCKTGYFDYPTSNSFGESWVKASAKGSAAFWGSSRDTYQYNYAAIPLILENLYEYNFGTIGGVILSAKLLDYGDIRITNLFGDPALNVSGHRATSTKPELTSSIFLSEVDADPVAGERITINVKIENKGLSAAENIVVRLSEVLPDSEDLFAVGDDEVVALLNFGESVVLSKEWIYQGQDTAFFRVDVDPDDAIDELSEYNNNNPRFDSSTNTVKRQIGFNFNPIYVDDDNTTGTEDGSVEYPFNTINEALTFLYQNPAGDNAVRMIYVMEGHYQAGGQIGISPGSVPIYVKGIGNAEDVIIGDSVNINSSSTDNVTFENVTFDRNYQWPTLTMRYGNIIGCVFRHNFVGAVARSGYFDRNIFYENQSAVKLMGAGYLTNNTIVDNDASFYALLGPFEWGSGLSSALLRNNIIWGNGLAQNTEYMKVQGDYNVSDDSFILGLGATNFSADPLFEDRVNADYHIIQQSPAVDAGNPDAAYNDPDGSRNDIGAFYLGHVEPAIEILAPVEGESVSQRRVTVSGWAMFNFGANIKINGVPAVTTSIGNSLYNFSAENVPLHYINSTTGQLTARLADSVLVIDVKEVNYDWPLIEILSPQDQDVVGNSIVVSGFAVGPLPSSVAVNGVNASVAPTGSIDEYAFNAPIDLNFINGSAAIQVISRQGNDILETLTITVFEEQEQESVPPTASASAEPNPAMEGQSVTLTGAGSDPDGGSVSYHWTVPQGITVNNPDIARITFDVPQVSVDQVYNFILTVTDDENQTATADLSLVVENNLLAPSVEITADSNPVSEGAMVTVYAAVNDDGNIVSYDWQASEGIVLQVVDDLTVTFVAPQVDQDANYTISLTVTDNDNLTATDSVRVTVKDIPESNRPPVAQFTATPNPLDENTRSLLDASASTDPDGTIARYEWSASGGTIVVEPMDRNKAHFIAPSVTKSTDYMITLKVIDDAGLTDSKSITITVKDVPVPNLPPVAQFTVNPNPINEKEFGLLDASLSSDPDGAIARYEWTASKGMTITGQRNASANFMAPEVDQDTDYVITLKVIDSEGLTAEASMTVTVKNVVVFVPQPPVAVISAPSLIDEGQMIILDGSSSFDPDGNIVSYTWVSKEGLPVIRDPLMPAVVQVIAPKVSENTGFTFTLKVVDNDGLGFSANAVVVIRHVDEIDFVHEMNNAPVADNLSLLTQKNMALNITLTASDPDDDLLTFAVISQPAHGVVSGVAPNLIYMPSSNYVGADSFTFKANDGILDSNIAVVSIAVNDSIGSMPVDVDLPESGGGDNSVPILGQDNQNSSGDLGIYFGGNNTSFLNPKDETSQMKKRSSSLLIKKYSPIDSSLRIEEGQSISFSIDPNDRDQIEKLLSDAIKAEKDKFKIDRRLVFQWFLDGNLVEGADGSSWTYISSMGDIGEHSIFVEASYGAIYTDRSLSWDVQVISSDRSGPLVLGARADDYGSFVRIQALIDDSLTGGSQVANASLELTAGNRIIKLGSIKPVDTKFDRVKEYVSYDYILPEKKFKTLAFRLTAKDVLGNETSYPLNVDLPPEQNQKENTQANNQPEKPTKEKSKH